MALSNQAPGFSPLLKNNSIVAFGERLLSEICQEIAQQNPTILVNTPPRALWVSGQHRTQDQIQGILGTDFQRQSQEHVWQNPCLLPSSSQYVM